LAANVTWNNSGTNFNAAGSWTGGLPGSSDVAVIPGTPGSQPILSGNISVSRVTFTSPLASGWNLSSGTGSLTLNSSGTGTTQAALYFSNTTGSNAVIAPLVLGAASGTMTFIQTRGASGTNTLVLSGPISSTGGIAGLALNSIGGAGRSQIVLSGSNSYTGNTYINGGSVTLMINHANAVSSGTLILNGQYTLNNTSGADITLANNNDVLLNGNSTTFTGSKNLSLGSGSLIINGTRSILVSAGVLSVGSLDAVNTTNTLSKGSTGTLAIAGAAGSNFQGGFTSTSGTTRIGDKASLGTGKFSVTGGTLESSANLSGANAVANSVALNGNFIIGGANQLTLSGSITLNGNRTLTNSNTGATELSGPIFLSNTAGTGRTLTLGGARSLTVSGAIANFNGVGTAGNLTITNTGTVFLTNANSSYTGITTARGTANAVLAVSKLANGGVASSIGASSNAASRLLLPNNSTLRYVGSGDSTDRSFTINGTSNNHSATLDASGSGDIKFTNTGGLAYGTNNQTRRLFLTGTNRGNNTLAAALANNGSGATSVTKNGTGTWVLSGTNSYTGSTTTSAGMLRFTQRVSLYNGGTSIWTSANIVTYSGATTAFNVGGTGEFTPADIALLKSLGTASGGFRNGSSIGMDTTNATGGIFTYAGLLANTNAGANILGLKKLGTGTLELTANNTYGGATTVSAGTLLIQGAHTGTGALTVESNGTLGGDGSIVGSLALNSGAKFVFNIANTLTVNGAAVTFGGFSIGNLVGLDGSVANGTYTLINGTATFNFTNVSNWGSSNAADIGGGKSAYFQAGSWQLVVVPEPSFLGLLGTGLAAALVRRRRRHSVGSLPAGGELKQGGKMNGQIRACSGPGKEGVNFRGG